MKKRTNYLIELYCTIITCVVVLLCMITIPAYVEENSALRAQNEELTANATRAQNFIAAQAKQLRERPVVYKTSTIYKELP